MSSYVCTKASVSNPLDSMGANLHEAHQVCCKSLALLFFVCFALSMYGGCSHACVSSVDIVVCRGRNLSAVPANLSDLVWRLDLSSNAIASLSSSWTSRPLLRLEVLVLAQNALGTIGPGAFVGTPHLRHLDLSSNRLKWLIGGLFKGLGELEELLLFDNRLGRISGRAFEGLGGLRRLHLGRNRLAQLPPETIDGVASLSELRVFDLSSNMLRAVPVASILALPPWTQAGLYLHDNPLVCTCALRAMLQQWAGQRYRTMVDFGHGHPCLGGTPGETLNCSRELRDCTQPVKVVLQVRLGEQLLLPCLDSTEQQGSSVRWETPDQEASPGEEQHLLVHSNGTLEIQRVRPEDSGTYHCKVISGGREGSERLVEVIVSDSEAASTPHHTGLTALVSWMVSIVLLLSYLYFSPCRCRCRRKHLGVSHPARSNPQLQGQPSSAKKVVFVEPWMEVTAIDVAHSTGAANPVATRSILKNGGNPSDPPIREMCHLI
ncbi:amphoterin-induced protein 2-like [Sardina pilchardus]|uniref:amphoterin-induced protein 2-like n=1 Tax=Sardina pilchardus TaxID=27697 RepID=UPI002E132A01